MLALQRLGDELEALGQNADALAAFVRSAGLMAALAEEDRANVAKRRDLRIANERVAGALEATGDLQGALAALRKARDVQETVVAEGGALPSDRLALAGTLLTLGKACTRLLRPEEDAATQIAAMAIQSCRLVTGFSVLARFTSLF